VDVPSPDEKSVITYVSSIYDAFPKVPEGGEGISATVQERFPKMPSDFHMFGWNVLIRPYSQALTLGRARLYRAN